MSGIFGLIHLDDSPVLETKLNPMRSAMQQLGPDGGGIWISDGVGLGSSILFGTPEAVYERLPMQSPQGFVLTAEARLDNRPELCGELDIPASQRAVLGDSNLILRVYEKWGEKTPDHLIGDWSFAAWHPEKRKLFMARDHFGSTSLYYYRDDHRFAFASCRQALFALGIPRRLNEFYLACGLVSWPAHQGTQTIELDLHRLPPAHALVLQGDALQTYPYWRLEDTSELHLKDRREYVERLLSVYDRAVRDRLRSVRDVGVTLSGGLGSGSVASLAARALRDQDRRFKAYTSVPIHDVRNIAYRDRFGDELPFAQASASFAGITDLIQIRGQRYTPLQAIRRALEIHQEPQHGAGNLFWILDLLTAARDDSIGTLLLGQCGNATISWTGIDHTRMLKQLASQGRWGRVLQQLIYPLVPIPVLREARHAVRRDQLDWSHTAIHPDLARRVGLAIKYINGTGQTSNREFWQAPLRQHHAIINAAGSFMTSIWAENGAALGLELRDPTCDKRVLELAISIPDREFSGPDGYDRWMIRSTMQGVMPDEVRLNRRRGRQAADLGWRLIDSAEEVEGALRELETSPMARECLSLPRMGAAWDALRRDVNPRTTHEAVTILTRGLMAGLYLLRLENANA